ncbi:hypothetical protein [Prevotella nigrescens]|uniref:hypothetical protein n=1 Tax=Prevotella nigrescens TaxID=28133 RepID=UPI0028D2BF43|nr:hypothetical protein [Prevotella nigrescens]
MAVLSPKPSVYKYQESNGVRFYDTAANGLPHRFLRNLGQMERMEKPLRTTCDITYIHGHNKVKKHRNS